MTGARFEPLVPETQRGPPQARGGIVCSTPARYGADDGGQLLSAPLI